MGGGGDDPPLPPMSARCALYGETRPGEPLPRATLVVHHRDLTRSRGTFDECAETPRRQTPPRHTLIAIEGEPSRVWGRPLDPETEASVGAFVERHRAALLDHWHGQTDSLEMLDAMKAGEQVARSLPWEFETFGGGGGKRT